ncbi:ABC transporter substrate-binding protein [Microbacterium sp. AK031]|uniref:ABC transporter substrate-binding protein n=1 Tax=Microbacterium sp. AK031 TaxID=2723076 RepID=UPI0021687E52|nr:extracellular solute-binding protein [Microbacterium sp. AK031]MCS3843173.1 multiple sugar transport system substrate-binding protein [Microbacterium sp. AK031]
MISNNTQISRRGLLIGGLGLAATTTLLAACGPSERGSTAPIDKGSEEEGKLVVWGGVAPEAGPQALVDAFMKKYPKIKVEYVRFVNDAEGILKLDSALQGGVPIDVFFSYGTVDIARRSAAGLAMDLTDLARKDSQLKSFVQSTPISTMVDGKLFSIPTSMYPNYVALNADALDKAKIEVPFDWTMDDYHDVAKALKRSGFDVGGYNAPKSFPATLGGDYLYKDGGKESNFDHPSYKDELELVLAMEDDGSIFTQERISAEGIGGYAQNYFLNGSFGMMIDGNNVIRYAKNLKEYPHDFRVTFRPYPAPEAGAAYFNPGVRGDDVQISAKTQYPGAAWTFVKFWMGEGADHMTTSGKVSPDQFANPSDTMYENLFGPDADKLFDIEAFGKTFFTEEPPMSVRAITTAYTEISTLKSQIEGEVRLRTKSVDDAIAELKQKADEAITKAS